MPRFWFTTRLVLAGALLALGAACSDGDPSLRQRCESARDREVDVRIALLGDPAQADPALRAEFDKHRATLTESLGDRYLERCEANGEQFARCVDKARTGDEIRRCHPTTETTTAAKETNR